MVNEDSIDLRIIKMASIDKEATVSDWLLNYFSLEVDRTDYYVPVYDPEQVSKWESIIDKTPMFKKNAKYFVLKSNSEENLAIS